MATANTEDNQSIEECIAIETENTAAINCKYNSYQLANAELETLYDQAIEKIGNDNEKLDLFKTTHQSWIEYRDNICEFQAGELQRKSGGTVWPLIAEDCMRRLTIQRIQEILEGIK